MRYGTAVAELETEEGRAVLESVDVRAGLRGMMSDVVVTQTYRNVEKTNIEAVYTFPLPLDAVLLDLEMELNGKRMTGIVQAKPKAQERYEDAVVDGDAAVLLERAGPGLFTVNVGNILPGEKAVIRFRYAQLHHWQGDSLRFHLPTTIAPRYGDPAAAGLKEHETPEYALSADRGFSLTVRIEGELARAGFECPTHPAEVSDDGGVREISFGGGYAQMDRDFVLVLKEPEGRTVEALVAPDETDGGGGYVACASFHPAFPEDLPESPRRLSLVVDCSGSMGGDSIAQAKAALHEILSLLEPADRFNLVVFGSGHQLLFPEAVAADEANIRMASRFVGRIDADMGGTEIGEALRAACRADRIDREPQGDAPADILLITDGEVWNEEDIAAEMKQSGHRIFAVGVGSAVSEAFLRQIAEATGGACELVSPREDMSERIVRHFRRINQMRAKSARIEWPQEPDAQIPSEAGAVYAGDTLHVFGWFGERPAGRASLVVDFGDGRTSRQDLPLSDGLQGEAAGDLPRMAAHARLPGLKRKDAAGTAERYRLVTEHTSCVLVMARAEGEKAEDIPELRKAAQQLAAGWGGLLEGKPALMINMKMMARLEMGHAGKKMRDIRALRCMDMEISEPRFGLLIRGLNDLYADAGAGRPAIGGVDDLVKAGLDQDAADTLLELAAGCDEAHVVVWFLARLAESEAGKGLSRHVKRLVRKTVKGVTVPEAVSDAVMEMMEEAVA